MQIEIQHHLLPRHGPLTEQSQHEENVQRPPHACDPDAEMRSVGGTVFVSLLLSIGLKAVLLISTFITNTSSFFLQSLNASQCD